MAIGIPTSSTAPGDKPLKRVLYIEDNPINTALLRAILADEFDGEAELLTAESAEAGIDVAVECAPDVILMDLQLPGMDGGEAARRLKQLPTMDRVPIISVSASGPYGVDVASAGFAQHMSKPIDVPQLIGVLRNLFLS
jgi:CheY-like chemotaxis protein